MSFIVMTAIEAHMQCGAQSAEAYCTWRGRCKPQLGRLMLLAAFRWSVFAGDGVGGFLVALRTLPTLLLRLAPVVLLDPVGPYRQGGGGCFLSAGLRSALGLLFNRFSSYVVHQPKGRGRVWGGCAGLQSMLQLSLPAGV